MKTIRFLLAITILAGVSFSCRKDRIQPDYHVDVLRCKVNGEEWVATCPGAGLWGCEPIDCQYYWKDIKSFEIFAIRKLHDNTVDQSIKLYIPKSTIGINEIVYFSRSFKDWNQPSGCRFYKLDTTQMNILNIISVDTSDYIIKGNFEYTAINDCNDTLRITDGFFHVSYRF